MQAKIENDVVGPAGQPGFLLVSPPDEALEWDIQHEIASTSRHWLPDRQAWWIAAPYLSTARSILSRMDAAPPLPPQAEAVAPPLAPEAPAPGKRPALWARIQARVRAVLAAS